MWHSRPPRDPSPPLHGKCHLKFPFWFSAPLPYPQPPAIFNHLLSSPSSSLNLNNRVCDSLLLPSTAAASLPPDLTAEHLIHHFVASLSTSVHVSTKFRKESLRYDQIRLDKTRHDQMWSDMTRYDQAPFDFCILCKSLCRIPFIKQCYCIFLLPYRAHVRKGNNDLSLYYTFYTSSMSMTSFTISIHLNKEIAGSIGREPDWPKLPSYWSYQAPPCGWHWDFGGESLQWSNERGKREEAA